MHLNIPGKGRAILGRVKSVGPFPEWWRNAAIRPSIPEWANKSALAREEPAHSGIARLVSNVTVHTQTGSNHAIRHLRQLRQKDRPILLIPNRRTRGLGRGVVDCVQFPIPHHRRRPRHDRVGEGQIPVLSPHYRLK